jgi:hypothetical protein
MRTSKATSTTSKGTRQRQAHRQRVSGHEEHTRAKLAVLMGTKKQTGQRAAKLKELAKELGNNPDAAADAMRASEAATFSRGAA